MTERLGEEAVAVVSPRELHGGAGELRARGDEEEVLELGRLGEVLERGPVEQVVRRRAVRAETEPRRCVRLRVEVDHDGPLPGLGEARREVDRRRGLADTALLICKGVDLAAHRAQSSRDPGR